MCSKLRLGAVALVLMSCAAVVDTATPATHPVATERPEWFRSALADSAYSLQYLDCEKAPLDIAYTADTLWKACVIESTRAAEEAQRRIYTDALNECIEWRGVEPQCCFARVTDEPIYAFRREMCETECRARRVAGSKYRAAPKCQSEVVPVRRVDPLRFRTPMADQILAKCATGDANDVACLSLPTKVERDYCRGECELERTWFLDSLRECRRRVGVGFPASCEHLFADKPLASPATMTERKAECERRCSGALPPPQ